jgi:hypothetical protein
MNVSGAYASPTSMHKTECNLSREMVRSTATCNWQAGNAINCGTEVACPDQDHHLPHATA